jgi:flavorubredoxin
MTTQVRPDAINSSNQEEETHAMTTATVDAFAPLAPANHYAPLKIADDTYLIRQLVGEGTPVQVYLNSMVILGREPVIVDTGTAGNRKDWLNDVFGLVDPRDVKWVFISHDDHDHTGNLAEVMAMCENATLVTNWFQLERLTGDYNFPLNRTRWVDDGQSFDAGDRELVAVRPPVFDSPTTRGLYDPKSRVYWGGDFFATPVIGAVEEYSDQDRDFRVGGVQMFGSAISPWVHMADEAKYNAQVDRIAGLDIVAAAGGHSPILRRDDIEEVLSVTRALPASAPAQLPGQETLDAILAAMGVGA